MCISMIRMAHDHRILDIERPDIRFRPVTIAMADLRGQPGDFEDWAAAGATGWGWSAVRDAYDHMETRAVGAAQTKPSGDGPVWVQDLSEQMHPFPKVIPTPGFPSSTTFAAAPRWSIIPPAPAGWDTARKIRC